MLLKIYGFSLLAALFMEGISSREGWAGVFFGLLSVGLVFSGMLCVLPYAVSRYMRSAK